MLTFNNEKQAVFALQELNIVEFAALQLNSTILSLRYNALNIKNMITCIIRAKQSHSVSTA